MKNRFVILLFVALTFLLYFPVLGNGFLTDDYAALYRLLIQKRVLFEEMVRPLIDISFYCNYLISGLHPLGYYIFNFCVHGLTCFMVYRVALDLPVFDERRQREGVRGGVRRQRVFALTAGLVFLFYPFHSEGVVWLSGRLSSMAALFGLMAIHFALTKRGMWGYMLAVGCWWIGLFAYESIVVMPGVLLLFEWIKFRDIRRCLRGLAVWVAAGGVWLGMRVIVAGRLLPDYGKEGLAGDAVWLRFVKVLGRCVLPPEENARLMMVLFCLVAVVVGVLHVVMRARLRGASAGQGWKLLALEAGVMVALLPAVAFAVSTRTSEGDRLLYFPSCVLCILAAAVVMTLLPGRRWRLAVWGAYAVASVVYITGVNRRWVFASRVAERGLNYARVADFRTGRRVMLVNAPDEWEGAFIFRNNFNEGLVVNGIDTSKVRLTHLLTRLEYLQVDGGIEPVRKESTIFIWPSTWIAADSLSVRDLSIFYWNKYEWKPLILK
jgi:hypothetical protein